LINTTANPCYVVHFYLYIKPQNGLQLNYTKMFTVNGLKIQNSTFEPVRQNGRVDAAMIFHTVILQNSWQPQGKQKTFSWDKSLLFCWNSGPDLAGKRERCSSTGKTLLITTRPNPVGCLSISIPLKPQKTGAAAKQSKKMVPVKVKNSQKKPSFF